MIRQHKLNGGTIRSAVATSPSLSITCPLPMGRVGTVGRLSASFPPFPLPHTLPRPECSPPSSTTLLQTPSTTPLDVTASKTTPDDSTDATLTGRAVARLCSVATTASFTLVFLRMRTTRLLAVGGVMVVVAALAAAYVTSYPEEPDIDGLLLTVGMAVAQFLAGLVPYPTVSALLQAILHAWEPKPEDNYWENARDNVAQVCGDFINDQNLQQVEVYKQDLMTLMRNYDAADVHGDGSYPDKNTWTDAITTSIITHRYLVEASIMPWSLTVDFGDIASVHVLTLKDAAELYSEGGEISRWWVDLSRELDHYIEYGVWLEGETMSWRTTQIECHIDEAGWACIGDCYDVFEVRDHVREYTESCTQVHNDDVWAGSCGTFCGLYEDHVTQDDARWLYDNLGYLLDQWGQLKLLADEMAQHASRYYDPLTLDQGRRVEH